MSIVDFTKNTEFLHLADVYTPLSSELGKTITHEEYYGQKISNIEVAEFLVPVLGLQGAGKSSLLNALLMDELVLPVDADETTCIPVEIRYGHKEDGRCDVYFQDGRSPIHLTSPSDIEQYVHNNYNLGNEKGVSHIVVYKDNSLLETGLVLVDLPGVGSLTEKNVQTTMRYIEKLAAAIFLLRTVPPITRKERTFLSVVWPKLTTAWFVQNQWDDESEEEVTEGKEHNVKVLQAVADAHKTNGDLDIMVVNVYQAMRGRLGKNDVVFKHSGILELWSKISTMATNWRALLKQSFFESIQMKMNEIRTKIAKDQEALKLSSEDLLRWHKEEEANYDNKVEENRARIEGIEAKILNYRQELKKYAVKQSQVQMENLRSEMQRVIGQGIVDGVLLNRAYQECLEEARGNLVELLSDKLLDVQEELTTDLENLEVRNEFGQFTTLGEFKKEEKMKIEKALPSAGNVVGGIVPLLILGTGPVGWVVGIGGALLGGWLGGKFKKHISNERRKTTIRDLEKPLQQFRRDVEDGMKRQIQNLFDRIDTSLAEFCKEQTVELDKLRLENEKSRKEQEEDFAGKELRVKNDMDTLVRLEAELTC